MKSQVNKLDAVNKAYVDRIKYQTATGIILILLGQIIHSSHFALRKLLQVKR